MNFAKTLSYILGFIAIICTLWISLLNLTEIVNRASGRTTFYSQRASLDDREAILYFSCWTLVFIFICYLAIRDLLRNKFLDSILFSISVLLLVLLSTYVDSMFYHKLV